MQLPSFLNEIGWGRSRVSFDIEMPDPEIARKSRKPFPSLFCRGPPIKLYSTMRRLGVEMSADSGNKKSPAERYIETYLALSTQEAADATTDSQLASIVVSLTEKIVRRPIGAIVDVGCGQGALLQRLTEIPEFLSNDKWVYIGIDEEKSISKIQELARRYKINRRVEVYELDEFYTDWPKVPDHQIIVCRNVLHELRISDTATLLHKVAHAMRPNDVFLLQDLLKFPVSERHNACWIPDELKACLQEIGYSPQFASVQATGSGNAYFNIVSLIGENEAADFSAAQAAVCSARYRQWQTWMELEKQSAAGLKDREEIVEALDIDLQVTSLTRQLRDVGRIEAVLAPDIERRVRAAEFTHLVENRVTVGLQSSFQVQERVHFRERGVQLNLLEEFLRSSAKLAVVHGGGGCGKTTLVHRLLATRSYEKLVVEIDGRRVKSAWSFIETLFSQVGIRLAPEQLSVLGNLSVNNIEPTLRRFLNEAGRKLILFYDNFNEILNAGGDVLDPELLSILTIMLSKDRIKMILGSRHEYAPRKIVEAAAEAPVTVRVGRYAADQTVINILDDYFNRSASGLTEYPQSLLDAIDRHPLITSLAAQALQKEGSSLLLDQSFIAELTNKLRDQLWGRIVDPLARPAVHAAGSLRVAVPVALLEGLVEKGAIFAAQEQEVVYSQPDPRWTTLWTTLGLFKLKPELKDGGDSLNEDQTQRFSAIDHSKAASLYRSIYRIDDDPKWIRESYYHQLLSVDDDMRGLSEGLGNYYYDELVGSADYHFLRSRNFQAALNLYNHARDIRLLKQSSEMRRASCLIRVGEKQSGLKAYQELVEESPNHLGIKTSHVDAVLYRHEFEEASRILTSYGLNHDSDWVEWQWGRTHLGLDNYEKAISFLSRIVGTPDPDSHYYIYLARALDYAGDFEAALGTLSAAQKKFQRDLGVNTAYGVQLQRMGRNNDAKDVLQPLFEKIADNISAASALVKIEIENGSISNARSIIRQSERATPANLQNLVVSVQADVFVAEGHPEVALARLATVTEPDPIICSATLEAHRASIAVQGGSGEAIRKARNFRIHERYQLNARVQLAAARLALTTQDRNAWAEAISNLGRTRLAHTALDALKSQWP